MAATLIGQVSIWQPPSMAATLMRQVSIRISGEPAEDAGGVFREFMSIAAKELRTSTLLAPGADGGLLPAMLKAREDEMSVREQQPFSVRFFKPTASSKLGLGFREKGGATITTIASSGICASEGLLRRGDRVLKVNGVAVGSAHRREKNLSRWQKPFHRACAPPVPLLSFPSQLSRLL